MIEESMANIVDNEEKISILNNLREIRVKYIKYIKEEIKDY
jgi:hypothetical protein